MKITTWRCFNCKRDLPRKEFGEISLRCICKACQAEVTAIGTTPVMPAHEARVRAKRRTFKTPPGPCRDKD